MASIDPAIGKLEARILEAHSDVIVAMLDDGVPDYDYRLKKANEFLDLANEMKNRISNALLTLNSSAHYRERIISARAVLRNQEDGVVK